MLLLVYLLYTCCVCLFLCVCVFLSSQRAVERTTARRRAGAGAGGDHRTVLPHSATTTHHSTTPPSPPPPPPPSASSSSVTRHTNTHKCHTKRSHKTAAAAAAATAPGGTSACMCVCLCLRACASYVCSNARIDAVSPFAVCHRVDDDDDASCRRIMLSCVCVCLVWRAHTNASSSLCGGFLCLCSHVWSPAP